ncbi:MAG: alpha/beta hydrolase [bacterium]
MNRLLLAIVLFVFFISCGKRVEEYPVFSEDKTIDTVPSSYSLAEDYRKSYYDLDTISDIEDIKFKVNKYLLASLGIDSSVFYKDAPVDYKQMGDVKLQGVLVKKYHLSYGEKWSIPVNVYIPSQKKRKYPAALYCNGHSGKGKHTPKYLEVVHQLCRMGMVVFTFDEINAGERQFIDQNDPSILLKGYSPGGIQILDAKRVVDFIFQYDDVPIDINRIGVLGRSGGGFQAFHLAALDSRITLVSPTMYVSSYAAMIHSGLDHTFDNYLPGIMEHVEQRHLLSAISPRPVLICAGNQDIFPFEATQQTVDFANNFFPDSAKIELHVEDVGHEDIPEHRASIYRFFQKHFELDKVDEQVDHIDADQLSYKPERYKGVTMHDFYQGLDEKTKTGEATANHLFYVLGLDQLNSTDTSFYKKKEDSVFIIESEKNSYFKTKIVKRNEDNHFFLLFAQDTVVDMPGENYAVISLREGQKGRSWRPDEEYLSFCNLLFTGKTLMAIKMNDIWQSIDFVRDYFQEDINFTVITEKPEYGQLAMYASLFRSGQHIQKIVSQNQVTSFEYYLQNPKSVGAWFACVPSLYEYFDIKDIMQLMKAEYKCVNWMRMSNK